MQAPAAQGGPSPAEDAISAPQALTLRRPDDWHLHVRDGATLRAVVPASAAIFGRAIIMPNLVPPVTDAAMAAAYRDRILAAVPEGSSFQPLMTCYLTDHTGADDLAGGHADGIFTAAKLYPAHATTNSAHGVSDLRGLYPVLERMQRIGMPLLVHGEVTDPAIDIFDREAVFIERVLALLLNDFPGLKIVLEHITTQEGAMFVTDGPTRLAATVTPHHLAINRNAMLAGGIRPHLYCLPIIKREKHRQALRRAVTSGHPRFFLGTDSAPHSREAKECACGSAGIFSAPVALSIYARIFEEEGCLYRLEAFASGNGPAFYGLAANTETVTLERTGLDAPPEIAGITVFEGGTRLQWRVRT